jgi:hypothetical protein
VITEPISFTGTLTLEDALDLSHFHFRCVLRRSIRVLLGVFSLLIAATVIFVGSMGHFTVSFFLILALCAYYPFGWLIHLRLGVARRYRRHPEQVVETSVMFDNDSVFMSNVHMDMRLNWDRLSAVISTPRGLLFLLPRQSPLFWLPKRLFEDNNHREAILELAAEHDISIRPMA